MFFFRKKKVEEKKRSLKTSFLAGAAAGLVVDIALFPLDTLKTRLQSQYGFWKSGGLRGIYKGILPTAVGSAPCAAVFFATYNSFKYAVQPHVAPVHQPLVHMSAAAVGEWVRTFAIIVAACIFRVPTDIIKQRRQACVHEHTTSSWSIIKYTMRTQGFSGFYQGFWTTVLRDVPYAVIQFPLWEYFKNEYRVYTGHNTVSPREGAICGALAGAVSGAITTPLDVVKTRIMLTEGCAEEPTKVKLWPIIATIYKEKNVFGFFAGFFPRVVSIFIGGAVFFGVYEEACALIDHDDKKTEESYFGPLLRLFTPDDS